MPQKERVRVFNGDLKKTTGGLTKKDLVKNKRGKIVSKRKSQSAEGDFNNLGSWLRNKGDKFAGKPKGFKEVEKKDDRDDEKMGEVPAPSKPKKKKLGSKKTKVVFAKPKRSKKVEPMKAGEKVELDKVSVGNIIVEEKVDPGAAYKKMFKELLAKGLSEAQIKAVIGDGKPALGAKVRKQLKASKRKGKRRTKKQLLQDLIDV